MERNSTNFPTQLLAQLQKVYDEYARLRAVLDASDESEGAPRTAACLAGILKYYQYLVHWYMTSFVGADSPGGASEGSGRPPDAPRGLLVYHLMGMGKTFEAVAVSLSAIGILDSGLPEAPRPRRVIVVASKTLHGNFDSNLEKFVLSMGFPEADGAGRLKKARAMISYVTMDAHNMAEQVVRATRVAQVDVARSADFGTKSSAAAGGRRRQASGQTANALDGMLLVVDEAHNFFRAIINSPAPTTNARRLYTMIMAARDLKIMFLTGTPASKHPFELVPCFNMLTGTDLLPPQYNNFAAHFIEGRRIKNRGYLANRLVGLVSYAGYDLPRSLTEQFSDEDARVDGGRPRRNALRRPPAGDFGTKSAADTPLPQPADPWWRPTFALRTPQMDDQGISPGPLFVGAGFLSRPDAMRPHRGRKNQTGRYVGLAWSENSGEYHCQKQIQEFYALHAELKNSFAAAHHSVTHKAHLPLIFSKLGQEYLRFIPKTLDLKWLLDHPQELQKQFGGRPVILKESCSAEQLGVELLGPPVTPEKLRATKTFTQSALAPDSHVVSDLVPEPLLWDGRKFHLRIYILIHLKAGRAYAHLHEKFVWVITSAKPYVAGEWEDRDIHLSGASRSLRDPSTQGKMLYCWLQDGAKGVGWTQEQVEKSWEALKEMSTPIAMALASNWKPFQESSGGYKYYGVDAMLSADGRPWLLEVNNRPAWGSSKYIYPWLAEELIQWGLKTAASPHFGLASTASPFWEGPAALVPGPLKDIPSGLSLAPDDGRSDGSTRTWKVLHRVGEAGEAGEAGEVGEVVMGKNGRVRYEFKDAGLAAAGVTLAIEAYVALNPTGSSAPGTPNPDVSIRADQDPHDLRRRLNFSEAPDGVWVRPGRQSASSGRREIDEHSSRQYRSAVMSAVPDFVPKSARQRAVPGVEPPRWELYTASEKEKLTQVLAENPGRAFAAEDLLVDLATGRTPYFGEAPPYRTRKDAKMEYRTRNVHQGQRKLFLTELYLLSTRGADLIAGAKPAEPAVLLYAGAACGQHLVLLAELFPWIQFHLYDPAPFTPAVVKHPRLHTYREFFTDEVAAAWGKDGKLARCHGRPAFFLSDIRLGNSDLVAMEKQIVGDMEAQQTWVEIIRPTRASMLKFRPEYREVDGEGRERRGVELRYLQGEVLFQCWGPTFSTERRLIVSSTPRVGDGGCELAYAIYDVGTYDALSSAHNLLVRPWVRFHDLRLDVERAGGHGPSAAEVGLSWEVRAEAATWELYLAALPGGTVTPRAIAKHMRELSDCLGRKFADHFARARTPAEAVEPAEPSERRMSGVVGAIVSTDDTFLKRPTVSLRIPQILRDTDLDLVDIFATAGFAEDSSALEVHPREAAKRFASLAWSEPSGVAEFFHKQIAQYFKQPAELKNFLDDGKREATFKLNMYRSLQRNDPDFLNYTPETWDFTKLDPQALPFDAKTPVFLKASVGFGQTGVVTVSPPVTHKSLAALIEGLQATRKVKGRTGEEDYVISRHIPNALLWYEDGEEAGRKFHIRVYAIASVEGGRAYVQVHNRLAWVLTAAEPYERSRHPDKTDAEYWSDLDIHLTGGSRTPRSIEWFAEGAEHVKWTPDQMTRAWASVEKVAGQVTRIIAQNAAPYEEANSAYEIFGLDIMFDRSGQAWLIEINANSSWCRNNQMSPRVITEMLDWSLATTILPHFGLAPRPLPAWEGPAVAHGPLRNMPPGLTLRPSVAAGASRAKTSLTWEVVHTAPETDPSVTVVGTVSFSEKRELSYAGNNRDVLLYGLALALEVLAARYAPRNPEVSLTGDPLKLATDLGFRKTSEGSRRVLRKTNKRPQKAASVRQMVRIAPAIGGGGGSDRGGGSSDRGDGGGARSRSLVCAARLPQIRAEISYDPIAAFAKRGFTEADLETAQFVHLAWTESSSPGRWGKIQKKQFESLSAELKSTLGLQKRAATDKSLLYQNLKRVDPAADDYLPRTWPLAELLDTGDAGARARAALGSGPVIMKVPNSFAQRGVTVHGSFDPAAMRSAAGDSVPKSGGDMIVSDLVRDPLLWDGKKFHLRIYLLVAVGAKSGGARRAYAYVNRERVEVYTARLPFVEPGPDPAPANPDIHMSGGSRTEREYLWFRDAPHHTEWDGAQAAKAWEGALTALRAVGQIIGESALPYEESAAGFEVFGVDLMFDRSGRAWLLEVNDRLGWLQLGDGPGGGKISAALVESLVEWELNAVICPHFGTLPRPPPLWHGQSRAEEPMQTHSPSGESGSASLFWSTLKPLACLSDDELDHLGAHGSLPEIYDHLGPGHPWDAKRFKDLRAQSKRDERDGTVRQYYHWAIVAGPAGEPAIPVGYVGLRPLETGGRGGELQLRYFVAPAYQGKGLGRAGVSSALDAWAAISAPENPRVWIRVAADDAGEPANVASAALAVSLGFEREPGLVRLPRNQRRLRQPQSPSLVAYSRLARPAAVFEPKSPAAVFEPKSPAAAGGAETFSFPEQLPVRVEKVPMSKQQYRQYLMAREKESAEGGGGGGGTRGGPRPGGARPPPPLAMPGSERDTGSTYYVQSRMFGNYAPPRQYMPTSSVLDPSSITGVNVADLPDDAFTKETSPKLALMMENIASGPGNRFLIYSQFKGIGGLAVAERFLQLEGFERFELPAESSGSAKKTGGDAAADRPAGYRPDLDEGAIVGGGTSPLWVKVFGDYDPAERDLVSKVLAMQDAVHTDASRVLEFTPADLLMDLSATPPYPDLPYRDSRDRQAFAYTNLHRGQRKLFLTELYLLSTELAGHNEPCLIVYAGAATGHHLPLLSRLFPKAVFHLYDPAPFSKIVCKMKEVFHVYNDYFTDETAESWGPEGENSRRFGRPDFFICDIRLDAQSGRKDFENAVRKDMLAQQLWTRLMHPTRAAMLKFRLPYLDPEGAEDEFYGNQGTELYYLRGKVLWQCWPPRLSGETRLIINTRAEVCVEGKIPTCRYPLRLYESRTYTHNIIVRPWVRYLDRDLFRSIEGYDGSWDSRAEAETWVLYAKNAAADLRSTSLDAFIAKHMNRLSRELSQGLIQKKQGRGGSKVTGTLHGHFPRLIGTQFAEALAQRVREGSVGRRRLRHMTHQMKNSPAVHEELLQASVYFPMSREWLRLIDPVAGAAQPFDPSRDLRIDCDDERPVPLPVPKKIPLQAVGLSLPRRSTAVALIYFMADKIPARQISERNRARTVTLTGPITTISKNLPKLLAQLFPMVTLLDAPEMRVFRLNTDTKSVAAWDLTYHANSTVCDRCHSDKKGSQTTSLWGCWSPETAPAAHYHICQGAPGLADPKPIEPCEITEHSLSVAAAHLIYDRCWSRYQVPRSKLFGEQKLETVPGYDGCWDCTAEAHTWLRYMRFRHEVVGTVEAYVAGDYMRVLGDVLGEPLNPVHSGHGRFVSPRARAANLAAGYTIATSRRAARKAKQANSKAPGARVGGGEEPAAEEPAAEEPAAEEPAAEEPPAAQQLATPPRIPRYVVIHGEVPDTDRTRIQKIWQSPENRYGEIIRGILVTKAGALGLDLSGRQIHILEPYWDKSLEAQAIARFRRINALDYLPPEERTIQPYLYLAVGNPEVLEGLPPDVLEVPVALAGELPRGTTVDVAFHEKALQTLELNEDFRELIKSVSIECALYRDPAACRICRPTGAPLYHSTVEEDLRLPDACDPIRATEIQAKSVSITLADGTPATYHYVEDPTAALGYRFYSPDATLGWSRGETYVEVDPATSLYLDLLRAIGAV